MKVKYRGFEIDVRREKCLGGRDMVYWDIFRKSDGWQLAGDFSDDSDTIRTHLKDCKRDIDDYYKNPHYED